MIGKWFPGYHINRIKIERFDAVGPYAVLMIVSGHCRYGADLAKQLVDALNKVLPSCGSVRVSFSRRTPEKVAGQDHLPSF